MLGYHSLYLLEFFHKIGLGMKATRSANNRCLGVAAIAGLNGAIGNCLFFRGFCWEKWARKEGTNYVSELSLFMPSYS